MRKIDADFMTSKIFAKRLAIDNKNCLYYIFLSRDKSCHRNIIIIIVLIESEKMTHFASKKKFTFSFQTRCMPSSVVKFNSINCHCTVQHTFRDLTYLFCRREGGDKKI